MTTTASISRKPLKTKLMHLSLRGDAPSGVKKVIIKAATYYAEKLFSRQLIPHLSIVINLTGKIGKDIEGECEIIGYGRKNAPRHFILHCKYIDRKTLPETLTTLAHEFVHCKQFALREVDENLTTWKGSKIPEGTNYWDHPWELDAYGRQIGLYARAVETFKLKRFIRSGANAKKKKNRSSSITTDNRTPE